MHKAFGPLILIEYSESDLTICHTGWLDLALSFGVLGLTLALGSILWTLGLSFKSPGNMASVD